MEKSVGDNVPEYQKKFIDMLEVFMQQCYNYVDQQKVPPMSNEEREAKMKELNEQIAKKEKELKDLEERRADLSDDGMSEDNFGGLSSIQPCSPNCTANCSKASRNFQWTVPDPSKCLPKCNAHCQTV